MARCVFNGGTVVSDFGKPYFVAEANTSHNGNIETAKLMIDQAKIVGCNCIKFQSWGADSLYSKAYYKENPIVRRMTDKLSLNEEQLLELAQYCKKQKIHFASTPYSKSEVDFLVEKCDVPYIKIASMDVNNYGFIDYIARTGIPIVLSTGMSTFNEVEKAVDVIERTGNTNICLLYCVSLYPAPPAAINLRNIEVLRRPFPDYPIGFSDHTLGVGAAIGAVALGAALIEKHFTSDSTKVGWDNQMAMEPLEMIDLMRGCKDVWASLKASWNVLQSQEETQREKMRRSVIVTKDLKAGHILSLEDLDVKRPGTGLPPEKIPELIGRTLSKDVEEGSLIKEDDYA